MGDISEKIKAIRNEFKLTQEDFAHKIALSRSSLAQIETGKSKPTFDTIGAISSAFGVNPGYFYEENADLSQFFVKNVKKNVSNGVIENNNSVGDTIQNSETDFKTMHYKESVGDIVQRQLRKKEVEEIAFSQLSLARQKRERDEEILIRPMSAFTEDPTFVKGQKLQDLKLSYNKRIRMDLKATNKKLYEILMLVEDNETIIDIVQDVYVNYIANQPDPFDSSQYFDLENNTINIPDTIDYRDYKGNMIIWLEEVEKYKDSVQKFYAAADTFLKEVTGKDNYGF